MDCPFCILDAARTIKSNQIVRVILSNPRLMPGHLLVIPNRHVKQLSELDTEERTALLETTLEFQEKILQTIAPGCDIRQHYRPFQKQDRLKVHHLHIHLLPRSLCDPLYEQCQKFEKDVFEDVSPEEQEEMIRKLSE